MECVPWDKAWTLFQEKVGNETLNSHPDIPELAKTVARECDGLPLALITIGRAMSTKKTVQEWNHAITTLQRAASEIPGMGEPVSSMGKAVFPILKVSYDSLDNDTIKSCFLYCAFFPKYHSINKTLLVDYWIGEGLITLSDFNHIDEARNYGYDVIRDLEGACLLESHDYEVTLVRLPDTIRDMALWITTRECGSSKMLTIEAFDGGTASDRLLWYNAERICLMSFSTKVAPQSPNLLTLIYIWWWRPNNTFPISQNFFEYMPNLRVLDLTQSNSLEIFPTSITGLVELRYLSLSGTRIKELPEEFGKLVNLNYLDLSAMENLERIPSGVIGSLLELRVLKLFETRKVVDWDLDELYMLKHLNDVGITIKTQHNLNKLLSNKNLQMCTRRLLLLQLSDDDDANMAVMGNGIEQQQQQQQQQHLGFCFQNLERIVIENCIGLKDLTWVGYVPNLIELQVVDCEELVVIIVVDDETILTDIFKSLQTLVLLDLPKLKSICSRNALAFPCLDVLVVERCPQLN